MQTHFIITHNSDGAAQPGKVNLFNSYNDGLSLLMMLHIDFTFLSSLYMHSTLQMIVGCSSPKHNISEDEYCDGMHIKVQTVPKEMVPCAALSLHQDFAR